jgi:hypothetical protein
MASSATHRGADLTPPAQQEQRPCGQTPDEVDWLECSAQRRDRSRRLDGLDGQALSRSVYGRIRCLAMLLSVLLAARDRVPVGMLAAPRVGPPTAQDGRVQPTRMLPPHAGDAAAPGGQDRPGQLIVPTEALQPVGEQPAVSVARTCLGRVVCTPAALRYRAYRWRRPAFRALQPEHSKGRPAEPYLVLDLGEFTARCRSCLWQSAPCGGLVDARFAYSMHACPAGPVAARAEVVA